MGGEPIDRPFAPGASTHRRGRQAEAAGRAWLEARGYRIVGENFRTAVGEIDLIGEEGQVLCFIEIKARTSRRYGPALAAVSRRQQRRVARAAALYLLDSGWQGVCRFDVLAMEWEGDRWGFELVRNAFEAA